MTIAVHISAGRHEDLSDNFNFVCFTELAAAQPESHFIFIFDSQPHPELYLEPNCTPVILKPALKNNLLRHYWFNYKLPPIIQRYNADVFITSGLSCSFKLEIPQCLVVTPKDIISAEKSLYLAKSIAGFLNKAGHIFTPDAATIEILKNKYRFAANITLLHPGLKVDPVPVTYEEREAVKNVFTGGNEYFFYPLINHSFEKIKIVLKAFSIFKKWQKSSMRLILLARPEFEETILKDLALYKYRDDILILNTENNTEKLTGSAYSILLETPDVFKTALPAMKIGVPVIIKENAAIKDILPGAIFTLWDETHIAEEMMRLYKDESMRSQLIEEGMKTTAKYSWEKTSEKVWQILQNLLNS